MSVTEILKDISDHVIKSTQEALKQKMKILVNNVLSENEVKKSIKSGIECGIQKNIIPKIKVDVLSEANYKIDYATWTRLIGTNKEEFEKIIKEMKKEIQKQKQKGGGMRKTRVSRKKKTKKKKRRTRKLKKKKKQSGGFGNEEIAKALTQLADPMSVMSKSMETYTDAHAKPPTDMAREFSEGVLALVREAVNSVRQQTINSFQHIASEKHTMSGSFQNTLKTKIEDKIKDEVYPDYVINQNGLQSNHLQNEMQDKFTNLVIKNELIHKAYAQNKQNVKDAIDKYWRKLNKFNSQRAKNESKDGTSNNNGISSDDFYNNFKSQLETPLTQLDDFIDANKYNKNAETSLMEYAKEIKEIKNKDSQKDKLLDSLNEKYQSYNLYNSYKKTKRLGSAKISDENSDGNSDEIIDDSNKYNYQEPNMNEFIRYGNQNMGQGDAFELLKELHKFSTSKNAIESGNRKREEMRKNNQKPDAVTQKYKLGLSKLFNSKK